LETTPGQAAAITGHLDRYVVREDVEIRDLGERWGELFVGGDGSEVVLRRLVGTEMPQEDVANMRRDLGEWRFFFAESRYRQNPISSWYPPRRK